MNLILYIDLRQSINFIKLSLRSPRRLIPAGLIFISLLQAAIVQLIALRHPFWDVGLGRYISPEGLWTGAFSATVGLSLYFLVGAFSESPLVFALPELDFLFPTPVPRSVVMCVKLLKLYARLGVVVAFPLVVFLPVLGLTPRYPGITLYALACCGALTYSVLLTNLCALVNFLATHRQTTAGWLKYLVYGGIWVIGSAAVGMFLSYYKMTSDWGGSLINMITHPAVLAVFSPVKWAVDVSLGPFVGPPTGFMKEFGGLVVLSLITFVALVINREFTYESPLAASVRFARLRSALQKGGIAGFRIEQMKWKGNVSAHAGIPPFGHGAIAILWKNLNVSWRTSRRHAAIMITLGILALAAVKSGWPNLLAPKQMVLYTLGAVGYLLFLAPPLVLHALRADVEQADILKPIAIPLWQLVLAETLPGTLYLSVIVWIAVATVTVLWRIPLGGQLGLVAVVIPFIANAILSGQVAVSIIYPNWEDQVQKVFSIGLSTGINMIVLIPPLTAYLVLTYARASMLVTGVAIISTCLLFSICGVILGSWLYSRYEPGAD